MKAKPARLSLTATAALRSAGYTYDGGRLCYAETGTPTGRDSQARDVLSLLGILDRFAPQARHRDLCGFLAAGLTDIEYKHTCAAARGRLLAEL